VCGALCGALATLTPAGRATAAGQPR